MTADEPIAVEPPVNDGADEIIAADPPHAADEYLERWLDKREARDGYVSYAQAMSILEQEFGLSGVAERHEVLAGLPMTAHHVHLPPQSFEAGSSMFGSWNFNVVRGYCWPPNMPDNGENRLWLEVAEAPFRERCRQIEGGGSDEEGRGHQRSDLDEPARRLDAMLPWCRICESAPGTALLQKDGIPVGWHLVGTLHGHLILLCESCFNHVRAL